MVNIRPAFISVAFVLFSVCSHAENLVYKWDASDHSSFSAFTSEKYPDVSHGVYTFVSSSVAGRQNIYVTIGKYINRREVSSCDKDKESVARVNGRNIKVYVYCEKYSYDDLSGKRLRITPSTEAGFNYFISSLKLSKKVVSFEFEDVYAQISSVGFSTVWNSYGGDAL